MSVHFSQELDELKKKLLAMAGNAETAVSRAIRAFTDRDDDLARRVKQDDSILDEFEKEIDEVAIALLAKAPLASELRLITVAMKVSHDLERVGARQIQNLDAFPDRADEGANHRFVHSIDPRGAADAGSPGICSPASCLFSGERP